MSKEDQELGLVHLGKLKDRFEGKDERKMVDGGGIGDNYKREVYSI